MDATYDVVIVGGAIGDDVLSQVPNRLDGTDNRMTGIPEFKEAVAVFRLQGTMRLTDEVEDTAR